MASKTEICNLALSHLGVGTEISNVETDRGQEAKVCRTFWTILLETVLRQYNPGFARKQVALGLVDTYDDDIWQYAYRYPSDCLYVRSFFNGIYNQRADTMYPFEIEQDDQGILLLVNYEEARISYTARTTNTTLFPPDFQLALSYLIAAHIAPRITGGDPFKLGARALAMYQSGIDKSSVSDLNERREGPQPESEYISVRE